MTWEISTWGIGEYCGAEDTSPGANTDYDIFYGWEDGRSDDHEDE